MPYYNKWEDRLFLPYNKVNRTVCIDCIDHEQGCPTYDGVMDCKNLFEKEGNSHYAQCNCWSKEHGVKNEYL